MEGRQWREERCEEGWKGRGTKDKSAGGEGL